ncbi:MAG TPA: phosphoribosyltransferase [Patescibacteria group bacterium]|nr:phosphoribosyltransferase [Patescibacteria group bacterium]
MGKESELKLLHLSWNDVQSLVETLADLINESGYHPDLITAVSRGGFCPARMLCDYLDMRKLASLQVEYYTDINAVSNAPRIVFPLNSDVPGKRVLLVDDVSDSGTSLEAANEHVLSHGASEVRIATLHIKPWSRLRPEYAASETDRWVVYPWEKVESVISITNMLMKSGLSEAGVVQKLEELGFDPGTIRYYMKKSHP